MGVRSSTPSPNLFVRRLDKVFEQQIKDSKRQLGMYAIKDNNTRLEYRSLSNKTYFDEMNTGINEFVQKIKNAVEPKND